MSDKKYFDQIAEDWDLLRQSFFSENLREKAIFAAGIRKGRLAVDVGAGTGFITEELVRNGLRVIAVDRSEAMLANMQKKLGATDTVDFRKGDAEKLPVESESVDYVFANMLLHHVRRPLVAIKEMNRILKKGGTLVITDLEEHGFKFLKEEQHDFWMGFKKEDVKRWLMKAGFKKAKADRADEICCAHSNCGDEIAKVGIFMASGKK